MVVVVLVVVFVLGRTYFGRWRSWHWRHAEASETAGINVNRMRVLIYGMSSVFVALGTIMMVGRTGSASSALGIGTEFTCLTAGILGGISFKGGEGNAWGWLLASLSCRSLQMGCSSWVWGISAIYSEGFGSYRGRRI